MSDKKQAFVLMASIYESWHPVAVFTDKDEAESAVRVLNYRLWGDTRGSEDRFSVHAAPLSLDLKDVSKSRYWHKDLDEDNPGFDGYPVDLDSFDIDDPSDLLGIAMSFEEGTMDERNWHLREDAK